MPEIATNGFFGRRKQGHAVHGQTTAGYAESASTLLTNGEGEAVRLVVLSKTER